MRRVRLLLTIVVAVALNAIAFAVRAHRYEELVVVTLLVAAAVVAWIVVRRRRARPLPPEPRPRQSAQPRIRARHDATGAEAPRRYDIVIETARPVAEQTVQAAPPAAYAVETDRGEHAAAALAAAEHVRRRRGWPMHEVRLASGDGVASPWSSLASRRSTHYRVSFPEAGYTVATSLGDFKAVALATAALLRDHPDGSVDGVEVAELGAQPFWNDDGKSLAIYDWSYEWK